MRARIEWHARRTFLARSGSGHAVPIDLPADRGGDGAAPSPMELLLIGTGGCTAVDVVAILERMRQPVEGCTVVLEAERAISDPKVFTRILMRFTLTGRGLDPKAVERAVQLSADKYCSASVMLGKTADIVRTIEILEPGGTAA
jgi:putative redox protein